MAYTPINWQTGDTITADKLNRCDNGWGVSSSQLFSETVTTASGQYGPEGTLAYSGTIDAALIVVVFDGVEYDCNEVRSGIYGGFNNGPDFTEYPFMLYSSNGTNTLYTETAGSHTIVVGSVTIEVGDGFAAAVELASGTFAAVAGVTAWVDVFDAMSSGKLVYIVRASGEAAQCNIATRVYYDGEEANPFRVSTVTALNSPTVEEFVAYAENGVINIEL